jgi:isochorismate synthase
VIDFRREGRLQDVESHSADTLPLDTFLDDLPPRLARALAQAPRDRYFSVVLRAPGLPAFLGMPEVGPAVYWNRTTDGRLRIGAGVAWEATAAGEDRFHALAAAWRELLRRWSIASLDGSDAGRSAFVGFAFSPDATAGILPNALLWVPRVLAERRDATTVLHFTAAPDDDRDAVLAQWTEAARGLARSARQSGAADSAPWAGDAQRPADPGWTERVGLALAAIASQRVEKLVVTRRLDLPLPRSPELGRLLPWLAARHPHSSVFAVRRQDVSLVGASPERLLNLNGGLVVADALAGSAPRSPQDDEDRALGRGLLGSVKELAEHRVVVREILAALEPLCTALVASQSPSLLRLPGVQHLASHVHGRVRAGIGVFDLLERLHPTPAVGGSPRGPALDWLRDNGEAERGWYTGGVGWLEESGGDVWVALRCASLCGERASLFAGAGIVAGSDPGQELRETGWKLATMLEALAIG